MDQTIWNEIEMKDWILYSEQNPPDELIGKILCIKGKSVVDSLSFECTAKWDATCFMQEDEFDSWIGPIRVVTHWEEVENKNLEHVRFFSKK